MNNIPYILQILNSIVLIFGFIYGITVLKIALEAFTKRMENLTQVTIDHEHRLTVIETTCRNRLCDGKEA